MTNYAISSVFIDYIAIKYIALNSNCIASKGLIPYTFPVLP